MKNNPAQKELSSLKRWVCWERGTKRPKNPMSPRDAKSNEPGTWGTFNEAFNEATNSTFHKGLGGIGFMFSKSDPYVGIDLDHCFLDDGTLELWAREIVDALDSYTEISPSKKGLHIIVRAPGVRVGRRQGGLEVYSTGRYFTFTGEVFEGQEIIQDREEVLVSILNKRFPGWLAEAGRWNVAEDTGGLFPEEKFRELLANNSKFRRTWEHKRGAELGDSSLSSYDLSLVSQAVRAGWKDAELAALIRHHREKFGDPEDLKKALRQDYLERTIREARNGIQASGQVETAGSYEMMDHGIEWIKINRDGPVSISLTNFSARIIAEIEEDDGVEIIRRLAVEAKLRGRTHRFPVTAQEFASLAWVIRELGAGAILSPGRGVKDHARCAIQCFSKNAERLTVYTHFGWRRIRDQWIYLNSGCPIGAKGTAPDIEVDPGDSRLKDYALPEAPEGEDLTASIRCSLSLLELAPRRIIFPILAAVFRAPLGECLPVDFSLFLSGPTGCQKSELTALVQAHWGCGFHGKNLPGNWSSTANSLEKHAFTVKDGVFTVDDFAPSGTQSDVAHLHREAERLLRAQGNRAGRGRMRADGTIRPEKFPRGLIISSGEDVPRGHSVRARCLILEVSSGDVDLERLTNAQGQAAQGIFSKTMSAYLKWLAPQMDQLKKEIPQLKIKLREEARQPEFGHDRTPDLIASLMLGWETFLRFALEAEAITEAERAKLRADGWKYLGEAAQAQAGYHQSEDPARRFMELLSSCLSSGLAHCADVYLGQRLDSPEKWGWQVFPPSGGDSISEDNSVTWKAQGQRIGWVDERENLFLEPEAAFAAVQKLARDQGTSLPIAQRTLLKRLDEKGLIGQKDPGRHTFRKTVEGKRIRVIHLLLEHPQKEKGQTLVRPDNLARLSPPNKEAGHKKDL